MGRRLRGEEEGGQGGEGREEGREEGEGRGMRGQG